MTRLSPTGNSKRDEKVKYIDGQLADDKGSVKVVSFLQSLRQAMHDSLTKISLVDCEVKVKEACGDGTTGHSLLENYNNSVEKVLNVITIYQ